MSEPPRTPQSQPPDFSAWVDLHGDYLYKYASFRLRDGSAAEDCVQETFLAALKAYRGFEGRGSERTWLVGILKHKVTDHFRRVTREAPIGETEGEEFEHNEGKLQLVSKDFSGPNGIALSPDEKFLYVGNWPRVLTGQHAHAGDEPVSEIGEKHKAIMRYEVQADGTLRNGKLFFDFTSAPGEDRLDGIKVDQKGNLYVSAPGGLWVISPEGKHLGTIITPRHPHNMAWGDADGKTLYLCARSGLYRIRLNIAGVRP